MYLLPMTRTLLGSTRLTASKARFLYTSNHANLKRQPFLAVDHPIFCVGPSFDTGCFETVDQRLQPSVAHFTTTTANNGKLQNLKRMMGFGYRFPKHKMALAGLRLYLCCTELVDYDEMFDYLGLPDTFFSYFLLLQIHIWLVSARVAQDGDEGQFIKRSVLANMWEDLSEKSKKISTEGVKHRKEALHEMATQYSAAMFAYDEGSLDSDIVLAGALWRTLFQKTCDEPQKVAKMVHYIRKQQSHLDHQNTDTVLGHGVVTFLPFEGDSLQYAMSLKTINEILFGKRERQ